MRINTPASIKPYTIAEAKARGRLIYNWWRNKGPKPPDHWYEIVLGSVSLCTIAGKTRYCSSGLGRTKRDCWLEFEEKTEHRDGQKFTQKIIHVFEPKGTKKIKLNSFYLVKDNAVLDDPEPFKMSDHKLALERGEQLAAWWTGDDPPPSGYKARKEKGSINLPTISGGQKCLSGGLDELEGECWLEFEERPGTFEGKPVVDKLIRVLSVDGKTEYNIFYLQKEGETFEDPVPKNLTAEERASESRKQLQAWWREKGKKPSDFAAQISDNGRILLWHAEGEFMYLSGSLGDKRPCYVKFFEEEKMIDGKVVKDKFAIVYEKDRKTEINTFYFVKDGKILPEPFPVKQSSSYSSLRRNIAIANWRVGKGPTPEDCGCTIEPESRVGIDNYEGERRCLTGSLGNTSRDGWLKFEEKEVLFQSQQVVERIIHVYEEDQTTHLNSFYLVKRGKVLLDPEPFKMTRKQFSRLRSRETSPWLNGEEGATIPGPYLIEIVGGYVSIGKVGKKSVEVRKGIRKEPYKAWELFYEDDSGNKLVRLIEPRGIKAISPSYYLVQDGEVMYSAEPVQKTAYQISRKMFPLIITWWKGEGGQPKDFPSKIDRKGRVHFPTLTGKQRDLAKGIAPGERKCWFIFEEGEGEIPNKLVHLYEDDKTTLIQSYYLVKEGEIFQVPMRVEEVAEKEQGEKLEAGSGQTSLEKLRSLIGRGLYDQAAADYSERLVDIAPYWVVFARNSLLLRLAAEGVIGPFSRELSLGAGPSTSFIAWQSLAHVIEVVDYDKSGPMLEQGPNPNKIFGDMAEPLKIDSGSKDLVTIDSAFRYVDPVQRMSTLLEAARVLKEGGVLSITHLAYLFGNEFVDSLNRLGCFTILTPAYYKMKPSDSFGVALKQLPGKVRQKFKSFLNSAGVLIAVRNGQSLPNPAEALRFPLHRIYEGHRSGLGEFYTGEKEEILLTPFADRLRASLQIEFTAPDKAEPEESVPCEPVRVLKTKEPVPGISPAAQFKLMAILGEVSETNFSAIAVIIAKFSQQISLLEIARDERKFAECNQELEPLGYKLIRGKKRGGLVASLKRLTADCR